MDSEKISGIEMFRIAWHLMQLNESMKCLNKSASQIKIFKETGKYMTHFHTIHSSITIRDSYESVRKQSIRDSRNSSLKNRMNF